MADEALTVKGQSLFLFLKSTHLSFRFVFSIMKLPNPRRLQYHKEKQSVSSCIRLRQASTFRVPHLGIQNIAFCLRARSRQPCRKNGLKHYEQSRKYCANKAENR